jgi:hypothetical protein
MYKTYEELEQEITDIKKQHLDPNQDPICQTNYDKKEMVTAQIRDKIYRAAVGHHNYDMRANSLFESGFTEIPGLSETQVKDIHVFLEDKLVYNAHVPFGKDGVLRTKDESMASNPFNCYDLKDVLQCPHLLELVTNKTMIDLAASYLGVPPTLYSMNMWWSAPGHPAQGTQSYHRDVDDFKFLAFIVYLVDVDGDTGPHTFIEFTHDQKKFEEKTGLLDLSNQIFPPAMQTGHGQDALFESNLSQYTHVLTGNAGSAFLIDTFGIHRGAGVLKKPRLVFWGRYGLHKNGPACVQVPEPHDWTLVGDRIPQNEETRYVMRVLLC